MTDVCPECDDEYEMLGTHWRYHPSHRINFTDKQMEVLTGLLMSDGCVSARGSRNPSFRLFNTNQEYLQWLNGYLGVLSTGVNFERTARESAEYEYGKDVVTESHANSYSDVYSVKTRCHPQLDELYSWYSSGEKIWPLVDVTPTVFKHLYCGDGTLGNQGTSVMISMHNEWDNKSKIQTIFQESPLPDPDYYQDTMASPCWNIEKSKEIFNIIGDPPPGFRYKWL